MNRTVAALASQTGLAQVRDPVFNLPFDCVPQTVRGALATAAPALAAEISQRPVVTPLQLRTFPAAAHPERLPQNQAERRAYHVAMLGAYRGHEEAFDGMRGVHGMHHASRAFIFATVMGNILAERGIPVDRNAVCCGISAHDAGRQGNGNDIWEEESAAMGLAVMQNRYGGDSLGDDYAAQFTRQIVHPHGQTPQTVEEIIVQGADSLDIGRTQDFDPARWPFLRDPVQIGERGLAPDADLRAQLTREAGILQRLVDPAVREQARLNEMQVNAINAADLEAAMAEIDQLKGSVRDELAELRQTHSNEDYFARIENIMREHAAELPLLNRYYFRN
jgi:hypothetical protein